MCSSRWEMPAWPSCSSAEPVPIQKPSATERTLATRSVTTLTPESSAVIRCSGFSGPSIAVAPVARAARSALAIAARAPLGALAAVAPRALAWRPPATAARAHAGELLDRLARDVRVVSQTQPDATTLAVHLDDANVDLVAFAEHILDALHALAGRDVGDVQQAVRALRELDERAERRRLDDFAEVLVADLDLLHHHPHALHQCIAELAVGRVDQHLTVVVDVDLRVELLCQPPDRFAALADQQANLGGVDRDRLYARRELAELLTRGLDHRRHLPQDERARRVRPRQCVTQDLEGDARDLDVHLQRGYPPLGAGDLEVHVSKVVLHAGDVGEDDVVLPLLDQAHGDPGDGTLDRHAGVHQRQGRPAHRGHRRRSVGLEDVRDHADRVRELLDRRDHRGERALGQRTVTDVTPLDAAHAAGLSHREGREVVVVPVVLFRLQGEGVDAHLRLERPQRGDAERLGLPAREQRRAVGAGSHADFDRDLADLVLAATVRSLLLHGDALADDRLLELVERELRRGTALLGGGQLALGGAVGSRRSILLEDRGLDGLRRVLALELVRDLGRLVEGLAVRGANLLEQLLVDADLDELFLLLADFLGEIALEGAQLLD